MKKLTRLKILTLLVGVTLLMGTSLALAKSESLEQIISKYGTYLNTGDTQSIMALYSKEPIFMQQHAAAHVGRVAVKKAYESVFANIDLNIKFTTYEIEINGNTAWARTSSAGKTIILADGAKINEGNNELFIFKKESGEWKIHRYIFSTTTPRI